MPVKKDDSGRRSVQVEVEVPGCPEEVWQAIATGPGIASWFVPTKFENDESGVPVRAIADFGPGMESVSTITEWSPPHRFAADSADLGPDAPIVGTEWIVEARDGGTCTVRVVHSLFASGDEWDDQMGAWESGWPDFFRILRLYLTHFRGQPGVLLNFQAMTSLPREEAWPKVTEPLGLAGAQVGEQRRSSDGAPPLSALVERVGSGAHPEQVLMRIDEPFPGIGHMFAYPMGEQILISLRIYCYGADVGSAAEEQEARWSQWFAEVFPQQQATPGG